MGGVGASRVFSYLKPTRKGFSLAKIGGRAHKSFWSFQNKAIRV